MEHDNMQSPAPTPAPTPGTIADALGAGTITKETADAELARLTSSAGALPKEAAQPQPVTHDAPKTFDGLTIRETEGMVKDLQSWLKSGKISREKYESIFAEAGLPVPTEDSRTEKQVAFDEARPGATADQYRSPNYGIPLDDSLRAIDTEGRQAMEACRLPKEIGDSLAVEIQKVNALANTLTPEAQADYRATQENQLRSIWKGEGEYERNVAEAAQLFREVSQRWPNLVKGIHSMAGSSARVVVGFFHAARALRERNG